MKKGMAKGQIIKSNLAKLEKYVKNELHTEPSNKKDSGLLRRTPASKKF